LALELEYDLMPKKQNLNRGVTSNNIGVPLICPFGSEGNKSTFKKRKDAMKIQKIVWKKMPNRRLSP
jgi:hypothetical protein